MAKSLRSKSKRAFRAAKRVDPKSDYRVAEDVRLQRLSARLKASSMKPRALTDKEEYDRRQEGYETEEEEDAAAAAVEGETDQKKEGGMEVDGSSGDAADKSTTDSSTEPKAKISTSGPRLSRREAYRTDKGFMVRLPSKTTFRARGEKKKMTGKPHRRR